MRQFYRLTRQLYCSMQKFKPLQQQLQCSVFYQGSKRQTSYAQNIPELTLYSKVLTFTTEFIRFFWVFEFVDRCDKFVVNLTS